MRNTHAARAAAAVFLFACLTLSAQAQDAPALPPNAPADRGPDPGPDPGIPDLGIEESLPDDPQSAVPTPAQPGAADPDSAGSGEQAPASPAQKRKQAEQPVPKDRETMLAELYAHLAQAPDAEQAAPIAKTIEGLWLHSGSATIGVLMRRALQALSDQRNDLALKLLDAVTELAPDYAEGWSRRAYVHYLKNDVEHAIGDLRRALALEPNHYKALEGLARILRESGQKKGALRAYQQLLRINPYLPGAKDAAKELSVEVEGQGI